MYAPPAAASRRRIPAPPRHKSAPYGKSLAPISEYHYHLETDLGPQHWWPAKTAFEVIVGAILTQNTAWTNVERAIRNLQEAGLLSAKGILQVRTARLERLIRPSGYFRQKARKLKAFCGYLEARYGGSLDRMFATPTVELREQVLGIWGIGPETADSILLYAGGHPTFVVDAYTKRILERHGWVGPKTTYDEIKGLVESSLPRKAKNYNEFHAQLVQVGKNWCRPREPRCEECPLGQFLKEGR